MKHLIGIWAIVGVCLCMASCQQYDNTIVARGLAAGGRYAPMDPITQDSAAAGLVNVNTDHAGNPLISDSTYSFAPTWKQAWTWQGERGNRWLFWVGLLILGGTLAWFIITSNKGSATAASTIPLVIAIIVSGALIGGSLEWEKSGMGLTITKAEYQHLLASPGELGPAWDQIRVK